VPDVGVGGADLGVGEHAGLRDHLPDRLELVEPLEEISGLVPDLAHEAGQLVARADPTGEVAEGRERHQVVGLLVR